MRKIMISQVSRIKKLRHRTIIKRKRLREKKRFKKYKIKGKFKRKLKKRKKCKVRKINEGPLGVNQLWDFSNLRNE